MYPFIYTTGTGNQLPPPQLPQFPPGTLIKIVRTKEFPPKFPKTSIRSGMKIMMLGYIMTIEIAASKTNRIYFDNSTIRIETKNITDKAKVYAQFYKWWREQELRVCTELMEELYPIFAALGKAKPSIKIRWLKRALGNCSCRGVITIAVISLRSSRETLRYLMLHEMAHIIYPHHKKSFWDFVQAHMPDYKARQRRLNIDAHSAGSTWRLHKRKPAKLATTHSTQTTNTRQRYV